MKCGLLYLMCSPAVLFLFFFISSGQNFAEYRGRCRTAQSLAKDIIRTLRQSPGAFCFCSLQGQFQPPYHCQTLVSASSLRRGHHTLLRLHLPLLSHDQGSYSRHKTDTIVKFVLCFSQFLHMYMYIHDILIVYINSNVHSQFPLSS